VSANGTITLMGSGELTTSMVEVHKILIAALPEKAKITFLDTPAGFQSNADQISAGAVDYFKNHILQPMEVASYKSHEAISELDAVLALQKLRESHYILMGPGSPTYTIEQFRPTTIPAILEERVFSGCCLTAASAAALTMGRYTLPVYEIYKVGQPLHWAKGLDILSQFGLNLVVVPHWNNAEGGTHDTSRCFMGRERFNRLLRILEKPVPILGLDEHTACIINMADDSFQVRGIGQVTLQQNNRSYDFHPGESYPLAFLRGETAGQNQLEMRYASKNSSVISSNETKKDTGVDFWQTINGFEAQCRTALAAQNYQRAVSALLELERAIWEAMATMNDPDTLAEARALFRELVVLVGTRPGLSESDLKRALDPVVGGLLAVRQQLRGASNWSAADAIRDALSNAGIILEDGESGSQWRIDKFKERRNDQSA
jgi:peptidase E